jgi:hypothetical protein
VREDLGQAENLTFAETGVVACGGNLHTDSLRPYRRDNWDDSDIRWPDIPEFARSRAQQGAPVRTLPVVIMKKRGDPVAYHLAPLLLSGLKGRELTCNLDTGTSDLIIADVQVQISIYDLQATLA